MTWKAKDSEAVVRQWWNSAFVAQNPDPMLAQEVATSMETQKFNVTSLPKECHICACQEPVSGHRVLPSAFDGQPHHYCSSLRGRPTSPLLDPRAIGPIATLNTISHILLKHSRWRVYTLLAPCEWVDFVFLWINPIKNTTPYRSVVRLSPCPPPPCFCMRTLMH